MMRHSIVAAAATLAACSPAIFQDAVSAQTFVTAKVMPAVGAGELEPLLSDVAREDADREAQARWLRLFKELGPLVSAGDVSCNAVSQININPKLNGTFANCNGQATYTNGVAVVTVRLRKVGDGWQADSVNVNSDYFAKVMEKGLAPPPDAAAPAPAAPATTPAAPATSP